MNWQDKMKLAMELMVEACNQSPDCPSCPFCKYCRVLESDSETCNDVFNGLNW